MEFAAHQNMAAGARSRQLLPKSARVNKFGPDAEDTIVKIHRTASAAADVLLAQCAACSLSAIRPESAGQECPTQTPFEELQIGVGIELANVVAVDGLTPNYP